MDKLTHYTVDQQTREDGQAWQRTSWTVAARDKDNARTAARVTATLAGLRVGECYTVTAAN